MRRYVSVAGILLALFPFCLGCQPGQDAPDEALMEAAPQVEPSILDEEIEASLERIRNSPEVARAFELIEELRAQSRRDLILITETPAPPFGEERRGALYAGMLREAGADSVWTDAEGNVLALRRGLQESGRTVALAAHLDTVFPAGTDVAVKQSGDTLRAPGIGDDSRGLVEVLTVLRAVEGAGLETPGDLLFIGTVGEEGLGDLRGVKHLFGDEGPGIDAWIAIDGGGLGSIVYRALGSHRYRVTFEGPGGHSWGAFGLVNPHHALGDAIRRFVERADAYTREGAKTSYNIGVIGGGTSVNSIPAASWMEIDMRSEDPNRLNEIDALLHTSIQEALDAHNAIRRSGPELRVDVEMIGNRPSGALKSDAPIVQRAVAATRLMDGATSFSMSSTDSNIPISLDIPAITIGRGGRGGNAHSLDEWWVDEDAYRSIQWALLIMLAEAGWAE